MGFIEKTFYVLSRVTLLASLCSPCLTPSTLSAQEASKLAPTPPMGWNSWDSYGTTVREDEVKAQADTMAATLKPFGWQYIVVDIQWYEPNAQAHGYRPNAKLAMDANGRTIPATNRFPSAADGRGFKPLADYVHSKGLKFGIHILRGIPRQAVAENSPILNSSLHASEVANKNSLCKWNTDMYGVDMSRPGGQAYYDSIVAQYATWGVDFIKADDMSSPYHQDEIEGLHQAILHSGRPIVLSLSPGPAPLAKAENLRENAQMWRIEDDLWDNWPSVKNMNSRIEAWSKLVQPGSWPDADMLPLGHIGLRAERGNDRLSELTHDEQQTMMTLWSIARSPLMFGGDLPTLDPFTKSLLTNAAVLSVNQHSTANRVVYSQGNLRIWTATTVGSASGANEIYLAFINLGDTPIREHIPWEQTGRKQPAGSLQNLWTGKAQSSSAEFELAPHASALYSISK